MIQSVPVFYPWFMRLKTIKRLAAFISLSSDDDPKAFWRSVYASL
ncbi:hypothetical protein [Bartonella bilalgolemii]|nr:hypothetical protein [Bartonella sp. G70]